jgi:PAS domain S-box-containing protein
MGDELGDASTLERLSEAAERLTVASGVRLADALYRAMIEQVPGVIYIEVPNPKEPGWFKQLYASPQVQTWLGYSQEEWMADYAAWNEAIHPDDKARVEREQDRSVLEGDTYEVEYRLKVRSGGEVWVNDRALLISDIDGTPLYWQGLMTDITDRKKAEKLEGALEVERAASTYLREQGEMKDTLLTTVSHDLRNPLTAILGFAMTLDRDDISLTPEERKELTERIVASVGRLTSLVENLLDLDKVALGRMGLELREADVGALLLNAVSQVETMGGRTVHVDARPTIVVVDAAKVERIVENLLTNAARHTPDDANVWVSARPMNGGALIAVDDDGAGVPDTIRQALFEPLGKRTTDAEARSSGVGIGLSLVARFAELHGGRAWAQDRDNGERGAAFRVFLPSAPA